MILLCLKTAFSSFSPKICPNCLLFISIYTFCDTHPSEPSVFTILSFKNTAFLGFQIFFTTLQLGNMKQRKGFILLRYFSILQRYFFISQR